MDSISARSETFACCLKGEKSVHGCVPLLPWRSAGPRSGPGSKWKVEEADRLKKAADFHFSLQQHKLFNKAVSPSLILQECTEWVFNKYTEGFICLIKTASYSLTLFLSTNIRTHKGKNNCPLNKTHIQILQSSWIKKCTRQTG